MKPIQFPGNEKIDFNKKLNIKFGIDPTSDKLHLGHLIPLLQAKKLWEEGHHVDIVLGTFTAQLGDPSGKDAMRPILPPEETEKNAISIIEQVARIFGNPDSSHPGWDSIKIHRNGDWFSKMSAVEMINILSKFTTTQLLSRDSFQKRIEDKNPIGMHELVVPVLQGIDSVNLKTNIEIGGTDQLFNFGISRDMQRLNGQEPEICLLMPIINGTDGRKMSKSFGNCIFINDSPSDVFGKTMSISDELMREWVEVFFDEPLDIRMGPLAMKKELAFEITKLIWSTEEAGKAIGHFESVIQKGKLPENISTIILTHLLNAVILIRKCSVSEAKRLIKQGAVRVNDVKVEDEKMQLNSGDVVRVGKLDLAKVHA